MPDANADLITIFSEALERTDPTDRTAYLDGACGEDTALRRRVEALLEADAGAGAGRCLEPDASGMSETIAAETPRETLPLSQPAASQGARRASASETHPASELATEDTRPADTLTMHRDTLPADQPGGTVAGQIIAGRDSPPPDVLGEGEIGADQAVPVQRQAALNLLKIGMDSLPADHPEGIVAGQVIAGRYSLLDVLGEGGMGTVYRADQTSPVRRQVALKLIRIGMDSRAVLARFDAERQALALMDHPNIARVYDGGTTEAGLPFFVMELVKGEPITRYCDRLRLPVRARLELFVSVCQAVQHAHQKGIIHRDLKPGNVLVTEVDGRPTPKVIDFGVAKATDFNLTDQSLADTGAIVGTPAYMSPEQADPSSMDIDTRTDVYALGVILYELLAGSPPIDAKQFKRGAILEMLRMVREVEPPRPSTKLSTAEDLPNIAANRSIEPARLAKALQGELDWVVMKALEKDRTRRYETANGLGRDLQRYLADEVVEARPPSRLYRLQKFARKHRAALATAGAFALLLLTATVVSVRLAVWANTERGVAQRRLGQVEKANRLLSSVFRGLHPEAEEKEGKPLRVLLGDRLDQAARELDGEAIGDPLVVADLQQVLGTTQNGLSYSERAIPLLTRSAQTREALLGPNHRLTLISLDNLAIAHLHTDRPGEAIPMLEPLVKRFEATLGPDHDDTRKCRGNLAMAYRKVGRAAPALPLLERNLKFEEATHGPVHRETLISRDNLALVYLDLGRIDESIALYEKNLKYEEKEFGPDHRETLATRGNLGTAYHQAVRLDEALTLFKETLALTEAKLGPDHRDTLACGNNLGLLYRDAGRYPEAVATLERFLNRAEAKYGPEHQETLVNRSNLASIYPAVGRTDEAVRMQEKNLTLLQTKFGPDHPGTLAGRDVMAAIYSWAGKFSEMIALQTKTVELHESKFSPDHPSTLIARGNLGRGYRRAGRNAAAVPIYTRVLKEMEAKFGPDDPRTADIRHELASAHDALGRFDRSEPLYRNDVTLALKRYGPTDPRTATAKAQLAVTLAELRQWSKAEPRFREARAVLDTSTPNSPLIFHLRSLHGGCLTELGRHAEAEPLVIEGYEGLLARKAAVAPRNRKTVGEAADRIVRLYEAWGKPAQATAWKAKLGLSDLPADVFQPVPPASR